MYAVLIDRAISPLSGYSHEFRANNGAGSLLDADVGLFNTWQFSLYKNVMSRLRVSEYRTRCCTLSLIVQNGTIQLRYFHFLEIQLRQRRL